MMDRVRAARGATVAGVAMLALTWWFASQSAIDCNDGNGAISPTSALQAFQLAKTPGGLEQAIGCTDRLLVLDSMNRADLLTFIPSYGLFLVFATLALTVGRLRRIALLLVGIAIAGDVVETATQLWIGSRWPFTNQTMFVLLAIGSSLKFAGLGIGCSAIGVSMAQHLGGMSRWLGLGVAVFGVVSLAVFVRPGTPFIGLAMLVLLAACAVNSRRAEVRVLD